ncbi:type II toxin-antitoxin system death-on-curing family toxin [Fodinicurvata sediminis]|uniref:type II toxin-antitoxin system death-on-curing family toxin n=1 Tax=Fodinicurvata sediminis TaxID=1121832 RepID=UPI0003B32013|nr:Fic family protein [Fodinicurvata sediminis]
MSVNSYVWPHPQAVVDRLARFMEDHDEKLVVTSPDDLSTGFERARTYADDDPQATAALLSALVFEGIVTRHALLDGNKRLAWLAAMTFLVMNGIYLDAPEEDAYEAGMSVIRHETTVTDLAGFIERYSRPLVE